MYGYTARDERAYCEGDGGENCSTFATDQRGDGGAQPLASEPDITQRIFVKSTS